MVSSVGIGRTIGSGGRGEREWRAKEYGEERECVWSGRIERGGDQSLVVVKGGDVAPVSRGNINEIWESKRWESEGERVKVGFGRKIRVTKPLRLSVLF